MGLSSCGLLDRRGWVRRAGRDRDATHAIGACVDLGGASAFAAVPLAAAFPLAAAIPLASRLIRPTGCLQNIFHLQLSTLAVDSVMSILDSDGGGTVSVGEM